MGQQPSEASTDGGRSDTRAQGATTGHDHGVSPEADRRYLFAALALIVGFMVVEVAVAAVSNSLALLADAGHMLTDAGALAGAVWVTYIVSRPASDRWTFGLKRAEILSASINGIALLVVAALVGFDAIRRLISPPPVQGLALVVVASVGVVVNLVATWLLARANRSSMNIEGAFQHILTDLYAFVGTVVAGAVILGFGYRRADPVASLVVVVLMLRAAWALLMASGRVLLQGTPEAVDLDEVRSHLTELSEVIAVHEVHAWTLSSDLPVLSAHVVVDDACLADGTAGQVLDRLQHCLADHFDVEHSTFQLEPPTHPGHEQPKHP